MTDNYLQLSRFLKNSFGSGIETPPLGFTSPQKNCRNCTTRNEFTLAWYSRQEVPFFGRACPHGTTWHVESSGFMKGNFKCGLSVNLGSGGAVFCALYGLVSTLAEVAGLFMDTNNT